MKEIRLPRNGKEGFLYGSIICIITVLIMLFLNIGTSVGVNKKSILIILKLVPIIWIVAMLIESLFIGRLASKLVERFSEPTDGFNAKILFNILFCVTGMSLIMSVLGSMIGSGTISLDPLINLPSHWPRNFCVAFWCQILLAQPAARLVMKKLHKHQLKKFVKEGGENEE